MSEPISSHDQRLVLDHGAARAVVFASQLSPSAKLLLLALLDITRVTDAVSQADLAASCGFERRTITRLMPELAEAHWFELQQIPGRPSVITWAHEGPLADAWVKPGPRRAAEAFRTSSFVSANATASGVSRPLEREERAALEALEVAHDELRTRRGYLPDPAKWGDATTAALRTVARWTIDGAQRVGMTVPAFALSAMRHWFDLPGSSGVLARTGHPLAMLVQGGRCTDLAEVGRRVAAARLAYQRDDAAPLGPPAMSREELAARAAELAATVGRRVA